MRAIRITAVTVLAMLGGSVARADMIFTDQAAFLANVQSGSYLESFDALPQGQPAPSPLVFSGNGFGYTANTDTFDGGSGDGFFPSGPPGDTWLSTATLGDVIVFRFTTGNITAVGGSFFLTDFFGEVTTGSIVMTLDNGTMFSMTDPAATSFVGFTTSSPISSLTLRVGGPLIGEWPTANNLIVGAAVPAPSVLMAAGIGLCGALARRRSRQTERPRERGTTL